MASTEQSVSRQQTASPTEWVDARAADLTHTRTSCWRIHLFFFAGQEGDRGIGQVDILPAPTHLKCCWSPILHTCNNFPFADPLLGFETPPLPACFPQYLFTLDRTLDLLQQSARERLGDVEPPQWTFIPTKHVVRQPAPQWGFGDPAQVIVDFILFQYEASAKHCIQSSFVWESNHISVRVTCFFAT